MNSKPWLKLYKWTVYIYKQCNLQYTHLYFIQPSSGPVEAMDADEEDYSAVMSDPAFLQHLVGSLPGVDPNSEEIQSAVQALTQGNTQPKEGEEGKKEDEGKK